MKVYVDKTLIQREYISFLAPLLGYPDFPIFGENKDQIKRRYDAGKKLLTLSDKAGCDYFVYPKYFVLEDRDILRRYADEAKKYKKKVLVFSYGEVDDYLDIRSNIIRYKRSTNRKNPKNEYCLPPFPEDLLQYNENEIPLISDSKKHRYSLGYIGYTNYHDMLSFLRYISVRLIGLISRIKIIKRLIMRFKKEDLYSRLVNAGTGNYCRGKTIKKIKRLESYDFNFVQRKHALTTDTKTNLRKEYIQNLIDSDFPLLIRGFGNYSIRQYEVFSLGKIPIYIDTGAKLPFEDEIPYNEILIRIPFGKIGKIGDYIDRYIIKNKGRIKQIQKRIRNTYEQYFMMDKYYSKIIGYLQKK